MTDTDSLLDIPAFLLRGTPENIKAMEEGAARLAANPPPRQRQLKLKPLKGVQSAGLAKAASAKAGAKGQLAQLGYSPGLIKRISLKKAQQIVEDIRLGKGAPREDQV